MSRRLMIEYGGLGHPSPHRPQSVRPAPPLPAPYLTPREEELVRLLADGFTLKEAAHRMGITYGGARQRKFYAKAHMQARTTEQLMAVVGTRKTGEQYG